MLYYVPGNYSVTIGEYMMKLVILYFDSLEVLKEIESWSSTLMHMENFENKMHKTQVQA